MDAPDYPTPYYVCNKAKCVECQDHEDCGAKQCVLLFKLSPLVSKTVFICEMSSMC